MARLKATDLLNVRLRAPDIDVAERFLDSFGLATVARTDDRLFSRGTDAGAPCHIIEKGDPAFVGVAFEVESRGELEEASRVAGASAIERLDEPGGGERVRLTDPDGFLIDIVHGIEKLPPLAINHHPINSALGRQRRDGDLYRRPPGPARVKRLGHFVVGTPDVKRTLAWYRETLNLLGTDDVFVESEENIIASFSRLSRGDEYVDHHVFMAIQMPTASFNHVGFEVQDYDDIFFGQHFLKESGIEHKWGVGRHRLGSQVYNQWNDPWGRIYEHWTDTDVLNDHHELSLVPASVALKSQWGDPNPAAAKLAGGR